MSQPVKPPDEVFCMGCGPGTIMDADPRAHRLRAAWVQALRNDEGG